ncbi:MAG: 4-alpha-glucanotransferase [Thermoproteus sp.]
MLRGAGVLLHVSSLPGPHGVGDMGPSAYRLVDFLHEAGQTYWQVLPLNPVLPEYDNSPYSSISSFAGEPAYINLELLVEQGVLASMPSAEFGRGHADYAAARMYKLKVLQNAKRPEDLDEFVAENEWWLEDYSLYVALREYFGTPWVQWPRGLRDRDEAELRRWRRKLRRRIELEELLQYFFWRQWRGLKEYANSRGVFIIGDLPIYLSLDSADVWAHRRLFKLNEDGSPRYVAGVPPDYFSPTGQLWGNPVYDWDTMRAEGYGWWLKRLKYLLAAFDYIRLDHFRGYAAYWEVPAGEQTAVNGRWVPAPGRELFEKALSELGELKIIAEDLGYITPDVVELREQFGFPGMRVIQFAWDGNPANEHKPHNYVKNLVVYTGTHDNNTIVGWFNYEASPRARREALEYMGRRSLKDVNWAFIRLVYSSVADVAIVPIQDFLGLGPEARMNKPGTRGGNWTWRLAELPGKELAGRMRRLARLYGR